MFKYKINQGSCSIGKCSGGTSYKVKTFYRSQAGSDAAVMEMLDKFGPLYVSINANDPFGYYASGVYASTSGCSNSTSKYCYYFNIYNYKY